MARFPVRTPRRTLAIARLVLGLLFAVHAPSVCFAQSGEDPPADSLGAPPSPVVDEQAEHPLSPGSNGVWWAVPLVSEPTAFTPDRWLDGVRMPGLLADIGERHGHAMIFDPVRQRFLLFGGTMLPNDFFFNDVWERPLFGVGEWTPLAVTGAPPAGRWGHSAVYDPIGDRMIVFGGQAAGYLGDVWQLGLSGTPAWQQILPSGTPPAARAWHTGVFDATRNRLVVHGGRNASAFLGDVWSLSFDPAPPQWSPLTPSGTPPVARYGHVSVLDATRDRMVIYGGIGTQYYSEVWTLSLGTSPAWTLRSITQAPGKRDAASAVLDATGNRMLVFGGRQPSSVHDQNLWAFDLSTFAWTLLSPTGSLPGIRRYAAMAIDPVSRRAILQGGLVGALYTLDDTWALTLEGGPGWSKLLPLPPPPPPPVPAITSFDPTSGPVGTVVRVNGANFLGATSVTFNLVPSSFTVVSSSEILATVPATASSGRIRVTTAAGTGTSPGNFTVTVFTPAPILSSFTPTSGSAGTEVTITGSNFAGASSVSFNLVSANFAVISATSIQATVPAGATTGRIRVTTPGGTVVSSSDFTVPPLPPPPAPEIASFTPAGGVAGTVVTITGANFTGASSVTFNLLSSSFGVISASTIQATVPAGASTGRIRVTTPGGTATSAIDFSVVTPNAGAFRYGAAADFDASRGRHVVVGGAHYSGPGSAMLLLGDAHSLRIGTDSSWVRVNYAGIQLSPRLGPSAVYDPLRDRLLIFGGWNEGYFNDLYELRFSPSPTMQSLAVPGGPIGRDFHAAVYDPLRDRMLVFGGNNGGTALGDLWELTLDGTPAWRLLDAGNASTPTRMLAGMVLDPFADRLVLFGGWAPGSRNDLWQYPLSGPGPWSPIAVSGVVPGPRHSFSFRLDPLGQRAVLHSGKNEESQSLYAGTWEFSLVGTPQWRLLSTGGGAPVPRYGHLCLVDPAGNRMLLSGGFASGNTLSDVWRLQWDIDQPTPAVMSLRVDAVTDEAVEISGHVGVASDGPCRLERSSDGAEWSSRAEVFPDAAGVVQFVDRQVVRGEVLQYRLAIEVEGRRVHSEVIQVRVPGPSASALHGFSPNPSNGEVRVAFRLAGSGPAIVELLDVSGRRVATRRIEAPVIGDGAVGFASERLSPGIYFVRLTQGPWSAVRRGIVAP